MNRKLHFLLAVGIGLMASVGWLHAESEINTLAALKAAIESAEPGATITLTGDITNADATSGSAITIKKAITLSGDVNGDGQSRCIISGSALQNIIAVTGTGAVTIKNITIENELPSGKTPAAGNGYNDITVYQRGLENENKVILQNVYLKGNGGVGLVVNGSAVDIDNIEVYNHAWGSINLQPNADVTPKLTFNTNCKLAGPLQVYADKGIDGNKDSWVGFYNDSYTLYTELPGFNLADIASAIWSNKLTETGSYSVDFATELQTVVGLINAGIPINKVLLNSDIYISDLYAVQSNIDKFQGILNPQKTITLDGQNHKISGTFLPADGSKSYYVIKLDKNSAGSTIQNLTIEGTNATALDLIAGTASSGTDTTVYVKNVNLYDNTGGGLNVNATAVVAENLHTRGNGHGVRITVDASRGKGAADPHFTLKGENSRLEESVKIAYNAKENPATYDKPELARSIEQRLSFVKIETPDQANWKTTWQMASLSKSFKADNAVLTWTNDFDETSIVGKKLAKMTNAAELDSLFTFGGSTVDGIVWTAAEKQTLAKDIMLDRSFAIVGSDSANCILKGALVLSSDNEDDGVILQGLKFDYSPKKVVSADSCMPLIGIKGKINLKVENCLFNNNIAGYGAYNTMKPAREHQHVFYTAPDATGLLTVDNSVINLNANCQTAVLVDGVMKEVSLTNVRINGVQTNGSSQYGVYIFHEKTPVTLDNVTILLNNHYCIYAKYAGNQTITVKNNSFLSGYGALYSFGSDNMIINILNGSTLTGITKNNGPSDSFGALILQASNNKVTVEDSYIGTEFRAEQTAEMTPILISNNTYLSEGVKKYAQNDTIILKGTTVIRSLNNSANPYLVSYGHYPDPSIDKHSVIVEGNGVQFKDQNDKNCVIVNALDGTFRNAAVSLFYAIDGLYIDSSNSWHYAVANPGNEVIIPDTLVSVAMNTLNASKDLFLKVDADSGSKFAIPDSVVINCKDAYLVTGKNAATVLADSLSKIKPVFWLKQDTTINEEKNALMFTKMAVGSQRVTIRGEVTINNENKVSYNNRTIELVKDAILAIDVPLELDSVIFLTDTAQLVTTQNVTANVLQLNYLVKADKWSAFGFPKGGAEGDLIVKKSGADGALKFATEGADDGIWQANVSVAADGLLPQIKVKETNPQVLDSACIIATSGHDSLIVVTSPEGQTVALSTKPEIGQPVLTKASEVNAAFSFVANPNTHPITLNKTAYVLDEDGKTFKRTEGATIPAFGSYILADENTTSTLRSLRVGDTPTANEVVVVEGYFVRTGKGVIVIHTSEPVQVTVVDMLGRIYYNARVASDGYQISVPAGIYAVNRQKVVVK